MSTPTPRTQDAMNRYWMGGYWSPEFFDHARTLERELARERAKVRVLRDACTEVERFAIEGGESERLLRSALAATDDKP